MIMDQRQLPSRGVDPLAAQNPRHAAAWGAAAVARISEAAIDAMRDRLRVGPRGIVDNASHIEPSLQPNPFGAGLAQIGGVAPA
jgi:hypothetical protein